jgi:hypothetical protein
MLTKIKEFWGKYEYKLVLAVGFALVAGISFEFGYMQSKAFKSSPLVIEKPAESPKNDPGDSIVAGQLSDTTAMPKVATVAGSAQVKNALSGQTNCAFVGSKNSNKFYPPTCSYAKRIKPENVVCFATSQEALAQGRTASTGCK